MLFHGSYIRIADNTGAKYALCIKLLGYYKYNSFACIGDILVIVVKRCRVHVTKISLHKIYYALIVRTKKNYYRATAFKYNFNCNDAIMLDVQKKPLGRRVIGVVPRELRNMG